MMVNFFNAHRLHIIRCSNMNRNFLILFLLILQMGCANVSERKSVNVEEPQAQTSFASIERFSAGLPGSLPKRWSPLIIQRTKKQTQYQLVKEQGKVILHARAASASSGLMQHLELDPNMQPWLSWQWRIGGLIAGANNFVREAEDSPARIILGFDGDKSTLPFADQVLFETAKLITGHDFPYATLMYVWENKAPVGTVIPSTRSGRIRMIVAASGNNGIGQWQEFRRNIVEDFEKAFGEKPGKLIGIGVMTDTDNTGEVVDAWYGDIHSFADKPLVADRK